LLSKYIPISPVDEILFTLAIVPDLENCMNSPSLYINAPISTKLNNLSLLINRKDQVLHVSTGTLNIYSVRAPVKSTYYYTKTSDG
jgi:hypothetical protein